MLEDVEDDVGAVEVEEDDTTLFEPVVVLEEDDTTRRCAIIFSLPLI